MTAIFNVSKVISMPPVLECGLLVGILLVLISAAISAETLEIIAGLVGCMALYVIKERNSQPDSCETRPRSIRDASARDDPVLYNRSCGPIAGPEIVSRLRSAEPRRQPNCADGASIHEQSEALLSDIMPSAEDWDVCEELAKQLAPPVRKLIPEAKVNIIAHNSLLRVGRTGLRPEVDFLVTVPPKFLAYRLQQYMKEHTGDRNVRKIQRIMDVDDATLIKAAIRCVASQLGPCKLWRTAYRGLEPKVVLLVPSVFGVLSEDIHMHVYVNCPNTLRAHDVFSQSDIQAQKLIAFVRRWAQDRCIANTAHGHMPLYAWTLFAKHFCQSQGSPKKSSIELFGDFVDFYIEWYDSISKTKKVDGGVMRIEDPYEPQNNVAKSMSPDGIKRFRQELGRASKILTSKTARLNTLLEHCNPTAQEVGFANGEVRDKHKARPQESATSTGSEDGAKDDADEQTDAEVQLKSLLQECAAAWQDGGHDS